MNGSVSAREFYQGSVRNYFGGAPSLPYVDILARRALAGDRDAKTELVGHLAGIAEALSGKYGPAAYHRGLERDDLRQEAMCAMLAALGTWNPSKMAFRSYAYNMARFAVLNMVNLSHAISMSRTVADAAAAAKRSAADDYEKAVREYMARTNHSRPTAEAALAATVAPSSIYARPSPGGPGGDEHDDPLSTAWLASIERDYERVVERHTLMQALRRARNSLTERERRVLALRYGFAEISSGNSSAVKPARRKQSPNGGASATFGQISAQIGVSVQRAQNLHAVAVRKLRAVS